MNLKHIGTVHKHNNRSARRAKGRGIAVINAAAMRHTKRAFALQLYRLCTVSVFAYNFKQILGFQTYRRRVFVRMNPDKSGAFEKIAVKKEMNLSVFIV